MIRVLFILEPSFSCQTIKEVIEIDVPEGATPAEKEDVILAELRDWTNNHVGTSWRELEEGEESEDG